jgi:PAS domain S-box-containing protein
MSVSLFQHLHEGLLITDADLRALDVNPAYTQITGVPRDELLGTVPSLLRPDPADPLARQQRAAMWAGLRDHGKLARRTAGTPAQRRVLHPAGHHLHRARAGAATCATTCW